MRTLAAFLAALSLSGSASAGPASSSAAASGMLEGMTFDVAMTLVDPGAAPRTVLRFHPRPGATATYETRSTMQMDLSIAMPDGQKVAMPLGEALPTMVMTAKNTVGNQLPNGMFPVRIEQLGARVEGQTSSEVAAAMAEALGTMKGMAFDLLVDPSGRPAQVDVTGTADAAISQAVQQMADQMADQMAHFPTEAVGQGAKWTVDLEMSLGGLDLVVTQTNTLVASTADSVDYTSELVMSMGKGAIAIPGLPPGANPEIKRFRGSGTGAMRTDLATLASSGKMTMDIDMEMAIASGAGGADGLSIAMAMHQTSEVRPAN